MIFRNDENFYITFFKSLIKSNKFFPYPIYSVVLDIIERFDVNEWKIGFKKFYIENFFPKIIKVKDMIEFNIDKEFDEDFNSIMTINRIIKMVKNYKEGIEIIAKKDTSTFFDELEQEIEFNKIRFDESAEFFKFMLDEFKEYDILFRISDDFFAVRITSSHVENNDYYYIFGNNTREIQKEINFIVNYNKTRKSVVNDLPNDLIEILI